VTQPTDAAQPGLVSPPYPPLYTPFKFVTLRLAATLRDSRLSSNAVTVTWALLLVTAAVELAFGRTVLTFALVLVAILLDCLDGDLARCRRQPSRSGTLLEQIAHWIGNMSLTTAAGAVILLADPRPRNICWYRRLWWSSRFTSRSFAKFTPMRRISMGTRACAGRFGRL